MRLYKNLDKFYGVVLDEWVSLGKQLEKPEYQQEDGYVYLLHFEEPLHHAKHYIGWTNDLCQRLRVHERGWGAKILSYIKGRNKGWILARVWAGVSRHWERKLKNLKKATNYCPICNPRMAEFLFVGDPCSGVIEKLDRDAWTKKEIVRELAKYTVEYLVDGFDVVPKVRSKALQNVVVDAEWVDFFDVQEIEDLFEGLQVGQHKQDLDDGVRRGIIDYILLNIDELIDRNDAMGVLFVDSGDGFIVIVDRGSGTKQKLLDRLEGEGWDIDIGKVWYFVEGLDWDRLDPVDQEGIYRFFDCLKEWNEVELLYSDEIVVSGNGVRENRQMEALWERVSLEQLYKGAYLYMERQPAEQDRVEAGAGMVLYGHVKHIKFIPFYGTGVLDVVARVESEETPGKVYSVYVKFFGLDLSKEFDRYVPVKLVDDKTGEEFYSSFVTPDTEVAVYCGCEDFRHTFSYWLKQSGGLSGRVKSYRRKTTWWKPRNVAKVRSMCKHVFAVLEGLLEAGLVSEQGYYNREIDLTRLSNKRG